MIYLLITGISSNVIWLISNLWTESELMYKGKKKENINIKMNKEQLRTVSREKE